MPVEKSTHAMRVLQGLAVLATGCLLLEFGPALFDLPTYIFPPLHSIAARLTTDFGFLVGNAATTFAEALAGLVIAAAVAILVGVASKDSRLVKSVGLKAAAVLQTIPIVAVAPIVIIWGGPGLVSKIVMASLIGTPPVIVAAIQGFSSAPKHLVETLDVMGAPRRRRFWQVELPYALIQIFIGLRISAALSTIGAIVAEYAGSTRGIGYVIMQSTYRLDTSLLFAAVAMAIAAGLLLVAMVRLCDILLLRQLEQR